MRMRLAFPLLLLLAVRSAGAETMYAAACYRLYTFDSAAPETILRAVTLLPEGSRCLDSIDVDPRDGALYGRWFTECFITCPPLPRGVVRIDPETGETTDIWIDPDLSLPYGLTGDLDVDPRSGEIRSAGYPHGTNLHLDTEIGEVSIDTAFSPLRDVVALAFSPSGEAFALAARSGTPGGVDLMRLGGVTGDPPSSSGLLTPIAPLADLPAPFLSSFDISPAGTAFYSALLQVGGAGGGQPATGLYSVDLTTGATTLLGEIPWADGHAVTGIAAARPQGVPAIPALDAGSLVMLAALLAAAGAWSLARRRRV